MSRGIDSRITFCYLGMMQEEFLNKAKKVLRWGASGHWCSPSWFHYS